MYDDPQCIRKHVTKVRTDDFEHAMIMQAVEISGEQCADCAALNSLTEVPEQARNEAR